MNQQQEGFVVRRYLRFPLHTTTMYLGKDFAGQGILRELSRVGCHMLGNYPVSPGEALSLRISLPMQSAPVCIKHARVKWVNGLEFGVAFGLLDEEALDHLQQLLGELLDSGSYSEWTSSVA
jgi:PilZ domain-containing protein